MVIPLVADSQSDVASGFENLVATTFCTRSKTLERGALVNIDCCDFKLVNVSAIVVLGVCNCRLEHFLDNHCAFFRAECQNVQRLVNRQAANLIGYQAALLSRQSDATQYS